jgi:tetratricopeptide (TPR) repeat protein
LIVLGSLVAILALGLGSVLFGLWGDPMQWLGGSSVSGASPQIAPAPTAPEPVAEALVPAPAASTAAVGGNVPSSAAQAPSVTSAASAPVAFAKPVRPASGNEVVLRGDVAKTGIVSRTRGANTLEAGYAALLEGKLDAAAKAYNQALGDNPEERDALLGLAYIAHQKGQREQAQDLYRRVLRQEPGNAIAGAALLALDTDADSTITAGRARELAQQQPDSAAAVALAAGALARDGQVADAALLFARAQQLEPRNAMHAYNHAVALDRLGQYAAARLDYELALQLAQRNANAGLLTFSVDTVRQRIAQLRQSEAPKPDAAK